jgi:hypothetical protein
MSTSRLSVRTVQPAPGRCALDALGLAVALGFLPELVGARAGVVLEPHPAWLAVLVLAARYGGVGLMAGLIAAAGAVGIGAAVAGTGFVTSWIRFESGSNLTALGACLAISWVASWHLRRHADLRERLSGVLGRATDAEAANAALLGAVGKLRSRVDRTSTSLSFLRDVAARLEGTEPVAAAEAAAELALARTGASAVAVEVGAGRSRRLLAIRDAESPDEFASATLREADLIVPIRNQDNRIGSIALWGIPASGPDEATAHDLVVIASWCGPVLAITAWKTVEAALVARKAG